MTVCMTNATRPLWRNRDFMLLWSGQVVSTVGVRASGMAYPLLVLAVTGSPVQAGMVGFAQTLPYVLFYLVAGALVDRWDRKVIMLVSDAGRAVAMGSVVVALAFNGLTLAQIVAAAFVEGTLFIFFQLSESAALPRVVDKGQLPAALAQNQAREYGAELAGQPLGGLLFSVNRMLPFLLDTLSYVVSFVTVLLIRSPLQEKRQPGRLWADVGEGLRWLVRQRFLSALVVLIGLTNIVFSALPLATIVRARELGAAPAVIGLLFTMLGVGAILGSIVAPWLQRRLPGRTIVVGALWLWAVELAFVPFANGVVWLGIVVAATSLTGPAFNVLVASYRYALTPDRLQGRTQSAARLFTWGTMPLGALAGGFLLESTGARTTFVIMVSAMVIISLMAMLLRGWPNE
jgi:MFS family permease